MKEYKTLEGLSHEFTPEFLQKYYDRGWVIQKIGSFHNDHNDFVVVTFERDSQWLTMQVSKFRDKSSQSTLSFVDPASFDQLLYEHLKDTTQSFRPVFEAGIKYMAGTVFYSSLVEDMQVLYIQPHSIEYMRLMAMTHNGFLRYYLNYNDDDGNSAPVRSYFIHAFMNAYRSFLKSLYKERRGE